MAENAAIFGRRERRENMEEEEEGRSFQEFDTLASEFHVLREEARVRREEGAMIQERSWAIGNPVSEYYRSDGYPICLFFRFFSFFF